MPVTKKSSKKNTDKKTNKRACKEHFDTEYLLTMSKEDRLLALGKKVEIAQEPQDEENNSESVDALFLALVVIVILFLLETINSHGSIISEVESAVTFIFFVAFSFIVGLIYWLISFFKNK